jgi:hypothetical protein
VLLQWGWGKARCGGGSVKQNGAWDAHRHASVLLLVVILLLLVLLLLVSLLRLPRLGGHIGR